MGSDTDSEDPSAAVAEGDELAVMMQGTAGCLAIVRGLVEGAERAHREGAIPSGGKQRRAKRREFLEKVDSAINDGIDNAITLVRMSAEFADVADELKGEEDGAAELARGTITMVAPFVLELDSYRARARKLFK